MHLIAIAPVSTIWRYKKTSNSTREPNETNKKSKLGFSAKGQRYSNNVVIMNIIVTCAIEILRGAIPLQYYTSYKLIKAISKCLK